MSRCVEIKSLNDHTISSEEDILRGSEGDLERSVCFLG